MAILRKATSADFEKVYALLVSMKGAAHDKETWRRLFTNHWNTDEDYCGYVLMDGEEAVGFLGMIFCRREIAGRQLKACNVTTWVVKPRYRTESLKLVMPLMRMKDYLLTNFTAREDVSFIFRKLGFKELDKGWTIIPPVPAICAIKALRRFQFSFGAEAAARLLDSGDLAILEGHRRFGCGHLVVSGKTGYCYVVYHTCARKHLPFVFIDYVSDPALFCAALGYLRLALPLRARAFGTIVGDRLLMGNIAPLSVHKAMAKPSPCIYKAPIELPPGKVDSLYSELVLLNI